MKERDGKRVKVTVVDKFMHIAYTNPGVMRAENRSSPHSPSPSLHI